METQDRLSSTAKIDSSFTSTVIVALIGLVFFGFNAFDAALRAGNNHWINLFYVLTFLNMAALDGLMIMYSIAPQAFEKRSDLRNATLVTIIGLTLAFLVYLWISLPPNMLWLVWVACGLALCSASAMVFLCKSLTKCA
ncbi:hypothetical protein AMTRI_Chr05g65560 [Amborella trichopoda]|uniref:Uncharacterized protein n=1 Tax=Amborella trichopoda TaxID=13333 RepID=W1P1R0_AMBTC|nr:hypothetical protein AMTR_s00078p00076950 [Amborella trichopoda]